MPKCLPKHGGECSYFGYAQRVLKTFSATHSYICSNGDSLNNAEIKAEIRWMLFPSCPPKFSLAAWRWKIIEKYLPANRTCSAYCRKCLTHISGLFYPFLEVYGFLNPFLYPRRLWRSLTGLRPFYYDLPEVKKCFFFTSFSFYISFT